MDWESIMSKLMPVRAVLSFNSYRAGRVYEVDLDDEVMLSLIGVGYFVPEGGKDASAGVDRAEPAGLRGVHVLGEQAPESLSDKEDADVDDSPVSSGSPKVRARKGNGGSASLAGEGADGGEDASS